MRRSCAILIILVMLFLSCCSMADGLVMAGYEGSTNGRKWENNLFFKRMEEKTGLVFTFRQFFNADEYRAWVDGLTAGSDLPDVLFKASLSDAQARTLYEKGILIDLRPYLEQYMPNLWAHLQEKPERLKAISTDDGAVLTLPVIDPLQVNNVYWINETWLKQVGMAMPKTADDLTKVLRAFRDGDPNRNGQRDETPLTFSSMWDLRFLQHAFGIVTNDYYQYADDSGKVVCPLFTEENRAWLTWMHTLWEERLLDHSGFSSGSSMRAITDSKATITYGVVCGPTPTQMIPNDALGSYAVLQPLAYGGKQTYRSLLGDISGGTFAITTHCADPEAVLAWADYLYTEEGYYLSHVGAAGIDYEVHDDGTWSWLYEQSQSSAAIHRDTVISDGSQAPGYVPVSAQRAFDDAASQKMIDGLETFIGFTRQACPPVMLTAEEKAELAAVWPSVSRWCEEHMTWFVTGDLALNDETWEAFVKGAEELGMSKVTAVWQKAVDRYHQREDAE